MSAQTIIWAVQKLKWLIPLALKALTDQSSALTLKFKKNQKVKLIILACGRFIYEFLIINILIVFISLNIIQWKM